MSDFTITDGMEQAVITRLATINSATSILSLINGRPAKVTVDKVLALAARIESWAWRDLLRENPAPSRGEEPAENHQPERPSNLTPPKRTTEDFPKPNGHGQRPGDATEKQINAIFAIGRSKGQSNDDMKEWIKEKFGKSVNALTSREASRFIDDLKTC
jgi:hypothetical protein